jgi:DNA-binding HxlR family transcriptional regulator
MTHSQKLCLFSQRAFDILGKKWTGHIVLALLPGALRFNELAQQLEVVSDRVLAARLRELEEEGIVQRQVIAETPVRVEYALTAKGKALEPALKALRQWSMEWIDGGMMPEVQT